MDKELNDRLSDLADSADRDNELQMARADLYKIGKYAIKLHDMLKHASEGLEDWQHAKITKASDYLSSIYHSLDYELNVEEPDASIDVPEPKVRMESAYRKLDLKDEYKASLYSKLQERAVSPEQQKAAGIALKHKRAGTKPPSGTPAADMIDMSKEDLEDFAATKHKDAKKKK